MMFDQYCQLLKEVLSLIFKMDQHNHYDIGPTIQCSKCIESVDETQRSEDGFCIHETNVQFFEIYWETYDQLLA